MQNAVSKWGNSLALRLPRHIAEKARLFEGTTVDFKLDGNRLVIVASRPRYRLAELLDVHAKAKDHAESQDWGTARGKEAW